MVKRVAFVAEQNEISHVVAAALGLRLKMVIFKAAMIILLRFGRAAATAATQLIAQIDLEANPIR
jgi:hypothetical protein